MTEKQKMADIIDLLAQLQVTMEYFLFDLKKVKSSYYKEVNDLHEYVNEMLKKAIKLKNTIRNEHNNF